ncbi:unnamed protein product [Parnassius apollo]|uniref:(apollo) hypothetical protein n=1 Tax=Parnassius apollo TaxID=110799 RepID=A0A8S3XLD5_PARAO|nr:unnamed protein product [Parnassius apollo]
MKNDDMAFFSSLLPITKSFNIRQKLLFRSEILRKAMEISNSTAGFPSVCDQNYFSTRPVSTSRPGSSTSTCTSYTITSPGSQEDVTLYTVEETEAPNANVASQMQLPEQQYSSQALGNFPQEPIASQMQLSEQQYS